MNKVFGLCFILACVHYASTGLFDMKKGKLPPSQTDTDPICSNLTTFRQCYSDFLGLLNITNITESYENSMGNATYSRDGVKEFHCYFKSLDNCLTTNNLQSCVSMTTFKAFGMNNQSANEAVWDYKIGTYLFLTGYQIYYDNLDCINAYLNGAGGSYENTTESSACDNAANDLQNNQTCSMEDYFLRVCLQLWDLVCNDDVGAFFCNLDYLSNSWDNYGSTWVSNCTNTCPGVGGNGTNVSCASDASSSSIPTTTLVSTSTSTTTSTPPSTSTTTLVSTSTSTTSMPPSTSTTTLVSTSTSTTTPMSSSTTTTTPRPSSTSTTSAGTSFNLSISSIFQLFTFALLSVHIMIL